MKNSRRAAAFAVARWIATKEFASTLLPEGADRSFVQDIVYTVIRRARPLRLALSRLLKKWPAVEMESRLYVGAAQILYMPGVPDFAAVNETVEAAKECANPNVAKVVNGVLRNLLRRREEIERLIADSPLAVRESFPDELMRRWVSRFGEDCAERLAKWHNEPAETYLAYPDRFEKLPRAKRVEDVEGFGEGSFIVQDPGTGLAVELMAASEGDRILDACAAPGGKTIQLAWRGADVSACEVNPRRRRRLVENLARTRLDSKVKVVDAFDVAENQFDKVLVDAPCSNTGVLRRRPDARWNWSPEKLFALVKLQAEILDAVALRVRPGGRLVYSTCSNEPEENASQVAAFIARHPDFRLVASRESVPFETGYDGAFAAALERL